MLKKTTIIVEIGQSHDGSLGIAHSYIDALKGIDADVIKFQTHIAEAESSKFEPFRVKFSYEDKTRYDYWKRMSFTSEQWESLKSHCEDLGFEFMSTPTCIASVDLLEKLNVNRYKVGSGDTSNFLLLEKICLTNKPVIISTGMSSINDLDETVKFLSDFDNNISLLVCKSKYPSLPEDINLKFIGTYKNKYEHRVGYSDHSGLIYPSLAAVSLGASIIEVHVTFDKKMFGPDSTSSLNIVELEQLVEGIRYIDKIKSSSSVDNNFKEMKNMKQIFEKSLCVNRNMKKGDEITFNDLECKKPSGMGVPASEFRKLIGRILKNDKELFDFINESDLE